MDEELTPIVTPKQGTNWTPWIVSGIILIVLSCCCLGLATTAYVFWPTAVQPTTEAPAATEPEIIPDNTFEVKCEHQNAGKFQLLPGYSVNGGHIWVNGEEYLFVDDRVVVVTNNSDIAVQISSTDGVGLCNDVDYDRQVTMRFSEGCDSNGCSEVKWVNMTNSGSKVKVIKK